MKLNKLEKRERETPGMFRVSCEIFHYFFTLSRQIEITHVA